MRSSRPRGEDQDTAPERGLAGSQPRSARLGLPCPSAIPALTLWDLALTENPRQGPRKGKQALRPHLWSHLGPRHPEAGEACTAPAGDLGSGLWRGAQQESISVWLVRHDRKSAEGKDLRAHPRGQDFRRGPVLYRGMEGARVWVLRRLLPGQSPWQCGWSRVGTLQRWSDWRAGPRRCVPCLLFLCGSLPAGPVLGFLLVSAQQLPVWGARPDLVQSSPLHSLSANPGSFGPDPPWLRHLVHSPEHHCIQGPSL